jgi:20S proteasome alpha/beta subunit
MTPKPPFPKLGPTLKPKPRRPWRKSKMTIAAGFVCSDGIVLCADTQETITGYTKNSTEKIRTGCINGYGLKRVTFG